MIPRRLRSNLDSAVDHGRRGGRVRTIPLGRETLEMPKLQLAQAVTSSRRGGLFNSEENDEDGDP